MQRVLVVVSDGIKPFSTRFESLSMKPANFVRLTDYSIGQEPAQHCRLSRGEGRCATAGPEKPEAYSLEYGEDFSWPRTKQMPGFRMP